MASVNTVMLLGHLGRDPEVRYTPKGTPVANFTMATSRRWKDRDSGNAKEATDWHRIVAWGKLAEVIGEHLKKGSQVHVAGRLQTRDWTDRDGNKRYTTEVVIRDLVMLGKPKDQPADEPPATEEPPADQEPEEPEDIPF